MLFLEQLLCKSYTYLLIVSMIAYKKSHKYKVSFHAMLFDWWCYTISRLIDYAESFTNIERFLQRVYEDERVILILIRGNMFLFSERTCSISSLAQTSGRWAVRFTTGSPRAILRPVRRTPPPSTSSSSRARVTSRATVFINACRHVPELISCPDES